MSLALASWRLAIREPLLLAADAAAQKWYDKRWKEWVARLPPVALLKMAAARQPIFSKIAISGS